MNVMHAMIAYTIVQELGQESALHWAVLRRCAPLVKLLLERGIKPTHNTRPFKLSPLHLAAALNCLDLCEMLLDAGGPPPTAHKKKKKYEISEAFFLSDTHDGGTYDDPADTK